jgi:hypothetical protein
MASKAMPSVSTQNAMGPRATIRTIDGPSARCVPARLLRAASHRIGGAASSCRGADGHGQQRSQLVRRRTVLRTRGRSPRAAGCESTGDAAPHPPPCARSYADSARARESRPSAARAERAGRPSHPWSRRHRPWLPRMCAGVAKTSDACRGSSRRWCSIWSSGGGLVSSGAQASRNGKARRRCPVSAKTAFATAGAIGGTPGSPSPPIGASDARNSTVTRGAFASRIIS